MRDGRTDLEVEADDDNQYNVYLNRYHYFGRE